MDRTPLPIDLVLPEILEALESRGCVVIHAPPGAGKSTRVAPALLDAAFMGKGKIVLLQPRRIAATMVASRIAQQRGGQVGGEVGYHVRFDRRAGSQTRLLVATTGIFLRWLQDDPLLEGVDAVLFDEFHERSVEADLALAMTRRVRSEVRPDLKLAVMSATLAADPVARYLDDCPVICSGGRLHPIEIRYLPHDPAGHLASTAAQGVETLLTETPGDVLVFLPGTAEIHRTQRLLQTAAAQHQLAVLPLYGDLPLAQQQAVLQPLAQRKVVLATNVAETSITIEGVTAVVDTGWARQQRYDRRLGLNRLELLRISQASAQQRAGRAGRTQPGKCLRLWTARQQQALPQFETPEIQRVELSGPILQLLAWGERHVDKFSWFEPPSSEAVAAAQSLLDKLGAIRQGQLTDIGHRMARLPVEPRIARLLIAGARCGHADRAALAAALLAERDIVRRTPGSRMPVEYHSDSDLLDRIAAIDAYQQHQRARAPIGELLPGAVKAVLRAHRQLARLVRELQAPGDQQALPAVVSADEAVRRSLLAAFPDRVCRRRQPRSRRGVMVGGRGVRLSEQSTVLDAPLFLALEVDQRDQADTLVRQASAIEREWLPEASITSRVDVQYDEKRERVVAVRSSCYGDLLLEQSPAALPADVDPGPILAEAAIARLDPAQLVSPECRTFLARVELLRRVMPELQLPALGPEPWRTLLPALCQGRQSLAELHQAPVLELLRSQFTPQHLAAIEREAPQRVMLPGGRLVPLNYEAGQQPTLAARVQEFFGWTTTPRIARGRMPLLLHLLAPNNRVQQITDDLASFWKNTYPVVRKELRRRYPRHAWPEDPTTAPPRTRK